MTDAISGVSPLAAVGLISDRGPESGAQRSIVARQEGIAQTEQNQGPMHESPNNDSRPGAGVDVLANSEIEGLLAELSVHAAMTTFILTRDELRRQNEQMVSRLKEAQEEAE